MRMWMKYLILFRLAESQMRRTEEIGREGIIRQFDQEAVLSVG